MTEQASTRSCGPEVDTIAAVSTAAGLGAIALVRLSGSGAGAILKRLTPDGSASIPPRSPRLVRINDPTTGDTLDRALVTVLPGPGSYTGEDMVELSCHGGWLVPELILAACVAGGARLAEPGEFTRRAVLNGKMDLVQAEAVLDLIEGRSRALHDTAVFQLERGLSRRIAELRERLVTIEAYLAHHIDFPEEDESPVTLDRIREEAEGFVDALDELLATAPEGELLREGALTVLAGLPNSGKSSLFNALLGVERAIVTDMPGTTRDALEAVVSLGGFPFRLVDTAGMRETGETVERLGIEVAQRYLDRADLVLFCVEAGVEMGDAERTFLSELENTPVVVLRTKADLVAGDEGRAGVQGESAVHAEVEVSTVDRRGLGELQELLPSLVYRGFVRTGVSVPVLTRARQKEGVGRAREHVADFVRALSEGVPVEMASTHLRPAETALEELLGVISEEDVLDRVFREFCIGK